MIIKKYVANTVKEAVSEMKKELGDNAIVLTTRQVPTSGLLAWLFSQPKVEVTGGVERATKETSRPKRSERDALNDLKAALDHIAVEEDETLPKPKKRIEAPKSRVQATGPSYNARGKKVQAQVITPVLEEDEAPKPNMQEAEASLQRLVSHFTGDTELEEKVKTTSDVDGIRRVIREEMERAQRSVSVGRVDGGDEETLGSVRFLVMKGLPRKLALEIESSLDAELGKTDMTLPSPGRTKRINRLKQELSHLIKTTGPILLKPGVCTVAAIVGPTGVGKTTTLGKIASQYTQSLGKKVGIISLDSVKLGAREQIQVLAGQLGIPLAIASSPAELTKELSTFKDFDLVLIDTAGQSLYKSGQVESLQQMLLAVPELKTYLAVSAATKDVDIFGAITRFSRMPLEGLIFTKVDETIQHGVLVHACHKTGLPLTYLTTGQAITGDLEIADAGSIARSILVQNNDTNARGIREQALA